MSKIVCEICGFKCNAKPMMSYHKETEHSDNTNAISNTTNEKRVSQESKSKEKYRDIAFGFTSKEIEILERVISKIKGNQEFDYKKRNKALPNSKFDCFGNLITSDIESKGAVIKHREKTKPKNAHQVLHMDITSQLPINQEIKRKGNPFYELREVIDKNGKTVKRYFKKC